MKYLACLLLLTSFCTAEIKKIPGVNGENVNATPFITALGGTNAGKALFQAADTAAQRAAIGLVIGTNVQAWDAQLDTWAATTPSDLGLGLVQAPSAFLAKQELDLENVDNTSDDDKPVSTAVTTELSKKVEADLALADVINFQPHATAKAMVDDISTRIAVTGDSLSTLGGLALGPYMGVVGRFGAGYTHISGTAPTSNLGSADWFVAGSGRSESVQFVAGSTVELSCGGATATPIQGDRFSIYIVKKTTGGTFDVQWSSNNSGTWTTMTTGANGFDGENVSANNATPLGFVITGHFSTSARPAYKIRITDVTGGGVAVIGAGIYNSKGKGVISMGDLLCCGGVDFPGPLNCPQAIWEPILRDMAVDLVLSCWADSGDNWLPAGGGGLTGNFDTYMNRFVTANTFTVASCLTTSASVNVTYPASYMPKTGMIVSGTGIPASTYITRIDSPTQFTMSNAATASGTVTLTFTNPTDWVQISAHPLTSYETGVGEYLAAQQAWAVRNKQSFINMHTVFRDVQWMVDLALKGSIDDAHLTAKAGAARWAHMWSKLPIGQMPLGGAMGNYGQDPVIAVNGGTGANDAVIMSRPMHLRGSNAALLLQDRTNLYGDGNATSIYFNASELYAGYTISGWSSLAGIHPTGNNLMLGGRGGLRYRVGATGIQLGYRATTVDATFATDDHTIEVTSGSPAITLPAVSAISATVSISANVGAGIGGKVFILANTGAGTPSIVGTVSGSVNPTVAAQTTWTMQSTGAAWKLLSKASNAP
jgi:hypothetical protein